MTLTSLNGLRATIGFTRTSVLLLPVGGGGALTLLRGQELMHECTLDLPELLPRFAHEEFINASLYLLSNKSKAKKKERRDCWLPGYLSRHQEHS